MTAARTADLTAFVVHEADRGMSPATRKSQVSALRRCFAWLVEAGHSRHDPAALLRSPAAPRPPIIVYPPADIAAILQHTAGLTHLWGRIRHAVIATLRYTGVRSAELRGMRLDRMDLDAGEIHVVGKGARPRVAVVPPALVAILQAYLDGTRPLLPDSPLLIAELAGTHAGVEGPHHPHRWRHTYATELVRAGVDIHLVQRLLGHRSIAATVGYTRLAVDDLKAAAAVLP